MMVTCVKCRTRPIRADSRRRLREAASMSDKTVAPSSVEVLIKSMDDIAREIGKMDPDDPVRAERLKELSRSQN